MELQDFITELTCMINRNKVKLMLYDIILIYEGNYNDYANYVDTMKILNNKLIKNNSLNDCSFSISTTYEPTHEIIEEWQYNYLVRLGCGKNGKEKSNR